ncbi:MAG: hypothetical protein N4A72_09260 [Bacteroidales bacterium]|nr:hypothetical protein [Bacteroidales bacterium]
MYRTYVFASFNIANVKTNIEGTKPNIIKILISKATICHFNLPFNDTPDENFTID